MFWYRCWTQAISCLLRNRQSFTFVSCRDSDCSELSSTVGRGQLKCDGTRAETRVRLSAKRTSPFKPAGVSVQSTTGSRGMCISGSNAGYTMFRGSVKGTGYTIRSPVSPELPLPCVTVCHHISTGVHTPLWLGLVLRTVYGQYAIAEGILHTLQLPHSTL